MRRFRIIRIIQSRPRLFGAVLLGLIVVLMLPAAWAGRWVTRLIVGWDVGVIFYLILAVQLMLTTPVSKIPSQAQRQDEGRFTILVLVIFAALASLIAIVMELAAVKSGPSQLWGSAHVGLTALTLLTSWSFTQVMFALHYAHDYYNAVLRHQPPGLDFPGSEPPDYIDFLYFACVIGTSGQTADVVFSSRHMRRTGLVHCVVVFLFNTSLLALAINIAAGLL